MQLQRLNRLMSIISDIRHNPRSNPEALCTRFAVSRRQFYKDRDLLASLGYIFRFSRNRERLVMEQAPDWDGLFSMSLALQALIAKDDLNALFNGLDSLRPLLEQLPPRPRKLLNQALEQLIWEQGLQCGRAIIEELRRCIQERRRVVVLLKDESHFLLDPEGLILCQGALYLLSPMLTPGRQPASLLPAGQAGLALSQVRKAVPTPFYSIQDT